MTAVQWPKVVLELLVSSSLSKSRKREGHEDHDPAGDAPLHIVEGEHSFVPSIEVAAEVGVCA